MEAPKEETVNLKEETKSEPQEAPAEVVKSASEIQAELEKTFFKSSTIEQPAELKKFLEEKMTTPYNKYCLDCKNKQTSHCIVWLGVYVCEECANTHIDTFGGNQYSYVKDVYKEQWDDYQLRSVCLGGNQPLFAVLKEYGVENEPIHSKYKSSAVQWYRKKHIAAMDDIPFTTSAPPKDWNERLESTKSILINGSGVAAANLSVLGGTIKEKGSTAGVILQEKTAQMKAKLIEKQMGNKIQGMFANIKAKAQNATGAGAPKQADEEEKKEPAEGEEVPKI